MVCGAWCSVLGARSAVCAAGHLVPSSETAVYGLNLEFLRSASCHDPAHVSHERPPYGSPTFAAGSSIWIGIGTPSARLA